MKYITEHDEELVKTINLMCHFPDRADKMIISLEQNYSRNPEKAEAAFAYGFLNFLLNSKSKDTVSGMQNFENIFNSFNSALKLEPDYWLVLMFKIILLLSLPEIMRDDKELVDSIESMISQQNNADRQEPYFIIPYIIYADYKYSCSDREGANEISGEGMKKVPKAAIRFVYLCDYFSMPFRDYMKRLVRSNEFSIALQIQELGKVYFPNEKNFKTDIRQGWM
jgi:hypothetical protein